MKMSLLILSLFVMYGCQSNPTSSNNETNQSREVQEVNVEDNLKALKITLPELKNPLANYVHTVRTGNLIYTAGKGSSYPDGKLYVGKVGKDLTIAQGKEAARLAGIRLLASLKAELGDLNKVKRIVKVLGMVNATSDFTEHSEVMNGFSDLMVEVFGEKGKHARSAVGMNSLPKNLAVEVEMVVEIDQP